MSFSTIQSSWKSCWFYAEETLLFRPLPSHFSPNWRFHLWVVGMSCSCRQPIQPGLICKGTNFLRWFMRHELCRVRSVSCCIMPSNQLTKFTEEITQSNPDRSTPNALEPNLLYRIQDQRSFIWPLQDLCCLHELVSSVYEALPCTSVRLEWYLSSNSQKNWWQQKRCIIFNKRTSCHAIPERRTSMDAGKAPVLCLISALRSHEGYRWNYVKWDLDNCELAGGCQWWEIHKQQLGPIGNRNPQAKRGTQYTFEMYYGQIFVQQEAIQARNGCHIVELIASFVLSVETTWP